LLGEVAEPDPDRCHVDGAPVDEVALVVAGGDGAELLELAETALDGTVTLTAPALVSTSLGSREPLRTTRW